MSLESLCRLFGYTRQAYWKSRTSSIVDAMDDTALLHEVREIRRELPRLGVRKLQVMLYQRGHDVGRDRLFDLLREAGMLVSRKRFRARTTDSRHWMRKWDNLIRDVVPVCMNQVWVSDTGLRGVWSGKRERNACVGNNLLLPLEKGEGMNQIYFEANGEKLLSRIGMTKSEFARQMGIRKQNVKALFRTKNLETIYKAAMVLDVPFEMLVGYVEEPELNEMPIVPIMEDIDEITEDDIPEGNTKEDRRKRQDLIYAFYMGWKRKNPEQKKYNIALKDDINIRAVSLDETAAQASLTYLSTLAVLQLDAILTNAWLVKTVPSKQNTKNQRSFERILIMEYVCIGVGRVKMTVGVRRSDNSKIQYCITAIDAGKIKQEAE